MYVHRIIEWMVAIECCVAFDCNHYYTLIKPTLMRDGKKTLIPHRRRDAQHKSDHDDLPLLCTTETLDWLEISPVGIQWWHRCLGMTWYCPGAWSSAICIVETTINTSSSIILTPSGPGVPAKYVMVQFQPICQRMKERR
jgi:hypothetical protein